MHKYDEHGFERDGGVFYCGLGSRLGQNAPWELVDISNDNLWNMFTFIVLSLKLNCLTLKQIITVCKFHILNCIEHVQSVNHVLFKRERLHAECTSESLDFIKYLFGVVLIRICLCC